MYEARQNKECVSRTLSSSKQKSVQCVLISDKKDNHKDLDKVNLRNEQIKQLYPIVKGMSDDEFVQKALTLKIKPEKQGELQDTGRERIYIFPYDKEYECQIHIHESTSGEIICGHIKNINTQESRYHEIEKESVKKYLTKLKGTEFYPGPRGEFNKYKDNPDDYIRIGGMALYDQL